MYSALIEVCGSAKQNKAYASLWSYPAPRRFKAGFSTWGDEEGFPQLFVSRHISDLFGHIHQPACHWGDTAEVQNSVTDREQREYKSAFRF